jgi:hypothetical protein
MCIYLFCISQILRKRKRLLTLDFSPLAFLQYIKSTRPRAIWQSVVTLPFTYIIILLYTLPLAFDIFLLCNNARFSLSLRHIHGRNENAYNLTIPGSAIASGSRLASRSLVSFSKYEKSPIGKNGGTEQGRIHVVIFVVFFFIFAERDFTDVATTRWHFNFNSQKKK